MKLLSIKKATAPHKFVATFQDADRTYQVKFGAAGYSDFTKNKDEARKQRYLDRHKANENWNKPDTPGALSRWILWNKPTLKESIQDFKSRFNL
jgi:hypothetical protein